MASAKGALLRLFSGVLLRRASLVEVEDVGGFRRLVARGEVPPIPAGTKLQVVLPSNDARTYTPIPSPEGFVLLGWRHAAGGPGARWLSEARAGDELSFLGPQRSLALPEGPVVVVGDETSVAVAAAFEAERSGRAHAVIQAGDADGARAAAASVGLRSVDVVAPGDTAGTAAAVAARLAATPGAAVGLTGGSALVVAVREALRAGGVRDVRAKAYWIPGKAGLD